MKKKKNNDFTNPHKIIFRFKESTSAYEDWEKSNNKENLEAIELLNTAGNDLFMSCEWAIKYHLNKRLREMVGTNEIKWGEMKCIMEKFHFNDLKQSMEKYAQPSLQDAKINLDAIAGYTKLRRAAGGYKHDAKDISQEVYLEAWSVVRDLLLTYIDNNAKLKLTGYNNSEWIKLFADCVYFEPGNFEYILISDTLDRLTSDEKARLLYINWSLVIDLDVNSDKDGTSGLAHLYLRDNGRQPHPVDSKHPRKTEFSLDDDTPYWYYAKGQHDTKETIINNTSDEDTKTANKEFSKWVSLYERRLAELFENFYEARPKKAKVFIFADEFRIVQRVCEKLTSIYDPDMEERNITYYCFSDMMNFISLDPKNKPSNWHQMRITADTFANQLSLNASSFNRTVTRREMRIPTVDLDKSISPANFPCYDILHSEIVNLDEHDEDKKDKESFFRADMPISWYGLKHDFDIDRTYLHSMQREVIDKLGRKADEPTRNRKDLIHLPGVGGTTFARRLAFNLHKMYPVVFLKNYLFEKSARQLFDFYTLVKVPVLVFADAENITQDQIEDYDKELRMNYTFPYELIYVRRKRQTDSDNCDIIGLNDEEASKMYTKLEPYVSDNPERLKSLSQIRDLKSGQEERTPFYMSLVAFDESFKGVGPYIEKFFSGLTDEEKKYFAYIAIADDYAQQAIDTSFFDKHENDLNTAFGDSEAFRHLIVVHGSKRDRKYKPRNPLFAKTIIHQILGYKEDEDEFSGKMIGYCVDLIRASRGNPLIRHNSNKELMK